MRDKRPALIMYVTAVTLVIIAKIFNLEHLLLVKSMVVPAIFYFYMQSRREQVNVLFSIAMLLFFIADMLMMVLGDGGVIPIMFCSIVSYIIIIWFGVKDALHTRANLTNIVLLLLSLILPAIVLLLILNMQVDVIVSNYIIYALYAVILWTMLGVAFYNYISKANNAFLYLCIAAVCLFLSDVFYCVDVYMVELPVISVLNSITQLVSYFFLVRYFNLRSRTLIARAVVT